MELYSNCWPHEAYVHALSMIADPKPLPLVQLQLMTLQGLGLGVRVWPSVSFICWTSILSCWGWSVAHWKVAWLTAVAKPLVDFYLAVVFCDAPFAFLSFQFCNWSHFLVNSHGNLCGQNCVGSFRLVFLHVEVSLIRTKHHSLSFSLLERDCPVFPVNCWDWCLCLGHPQVFPSPCPSLSNTGPQHWWVLVNPWRALSLLSTLFLQV